MGYFDRSVLANNDQNNGQVSDITKLEAIHTAIANEHDKSWEYITNLIAGGTLQPYPSFLYRQSIINGNFDIWQRGTTATNPADSTFPTADRWNVGNAITGAAPTSIIHSRQSVAPGEIEGSNYFYRITPNGAGSGFGVNDTYNIRQRIENGVKLLCGAGRKITLSFYAKSSIANKKIGIRWQQYYGSGGSPSAAEIINGQIFTLTPTWTKYTATLATNSISGKTFGTNNDDYIEIALGLMWGLTRASQYGDTVVETFVGAGNIDIAKVQINAGDVALPVQPRPFAEELALCQRYYEKSYGYNVAPATAGNVVGAISFATAGTIPNFAPYGTVFFKVPKRAAPTVTVRPITSPANAGRVSNFDTIDFAANSGNVIQISEGNFIVRNNTGGTLSTTFNGISFHYEAEAEL